MPMRLPRAMAMAKEMVGTKQRATGPPLGKQRREAVTDDQEHSAMGRGTANEIWVHVNPPNTAGWQYNARAAAGSGAVETGGVIHQ